LDAQAVETYLQQCEDDAWLEDARGPYGWIQTSEPNTPPTFERERCVEALSDWYAVRTSNQIPILSAATELPDSFAVEPYGEVRFHGPRDLLGTTQPATAERRIDAAGDGETVVVLFEFPLLPKVDGVSCVQVELLHPVCQNPAVAGLRRLTSLSAVNWLLVAVFGVFQDRIRTRVGSPIVNWFGRKLGVKWLDEAPVAEAKQAATPISPRRRTSPHDDRVERPAGILAALADDSTESRKRSA
jgi:hypothetical protein